MIRTEKHAVCDRCGRDEKTVVSLPNPEWSTMNGAHLCPCCTKSLGMWLNLYKHAIVHNTTET